ncbi:hypothetical protein N7492_000617 [Penicillium capsulatum]|uniref:J domain-containing protein n=1 Tax=Penicillium capsulatum TaxID=69766 RepID=A0A9W9IW82_9EURO|nr:hypothetical protein N7492_000617 [Penicillium capsulatum]KAJ6130325.1 hypothetical protein N7512_003105 [Penicillium capsulatum]
MSFIHDPLDAWMRGRRPESFSDLTRVPNLTSSTHRIPPQIVENEAKSHLNTPTVVIPVSMSSFDGVDPAARDLGASPDEDGLDAEYSKADDYPEEDDFYAILSLPRQPPPTEAEIRSAYRTLSLSFHPDKQPPHLRETARQHFNRIQEAYDCIIDPKKRTVYDLLGAEGVRQEWAHLGAMGKGGEAQRKEVGVRAMSPDEFRQWFLKVMRNRERKAVESLVSSRGTLTLGIDASTTILVDEDDDVTFHIPSPKFTTLGITHNFKVPFPVLESWTTQAKNEAGDQETPTESGDSDKVEDEPVQLTINAGAVGHIVHREQKIFLADKSQPDGRRGLVVPAPPALAGDDFTLGVTAVPNLARLIGTTGIWSSPPFSLLKDSSVSVKTLLLPVPALNIALARVWQPIPGTAPFSITTNTSIKRSLLQSPPSFDLQVSKQIAPQKLAVCAWSSGSLMWPESLSDRFHVFGMDEATSIGSLTALSNFQIGLVSMPKAPEQVIEDDDDDDGDDEDMQHVPVKKDEDRAAEAWQAFLVASPAGGGLKLTYSRNFFAGKPADDPVKSEWSPEGYFPMSKMEEARAVRLEVSTMASLDSSVNWSVKATRRIGEFTKMGLGVSFAENGIFLMVSWRRLGQGINLPVAICAADQAIHEAAMLTAIFSGLTYSIIEFGYIRPRDRKKRREAAARRHKELRKQIPMKREESLQAIDLMADQVLHRQAREREKSGLVVTKAEYGYYPSAKKPKKGFTEPRVIDVTIPVAARVDRGQLMIPRDALKFQLLGFYDPAPLLPKRLKIWYIFHQEEHFVEAGDKEEIACPMRAHLSGN